jgi:hypothetical protein
MIFKQAYARGCTQQLIDSGFLKVSSEEGAALADEVGPKLSPAPEAGHMDPQATAELLEALLALASEKGLLGPGAGAGGGMPPGAAAPKMASDTGSTITGDKPEQSNEETKTPNAEAKMDLKPRPEAYAAKGVHGVGKSDMENRGVIGEEKPHEGSEPDKMASLNDVIKKLAASGMGSTIHKNDPAHDNKPGKSPNAESKLDLENRGVKEHLTGAGKTQLHAAVGEVGHEAKHDGAEAPKAHAVKSAAWSNLFELTATEFLPKLPAGLDDQEKIAAIKAIMSFEPSEQDTFVAKLAEESKKIEDLVKEEKKEHGHLPSKEEEKTEHKKEHEDKKAADMCKTCSKEPCTCEESEKKDSKAEKAKEHDKKASVDPRSATEILRGLAALTRR